MHREDDKGFRFYTVNELITVGERFSSKTRNNLNDVILFADYMVESWWYGIKSSNGRYEIGIVPNDHEFVAITESLNDFIKLYLADSDKLYEY